MVPGALCHPLAQSVVKLSAFQGSVRMALVVRRTVGRINQQCNTNKFLFSVQQRVGASERVDIEMVRGVEPQVPSSKLAQGRANRIVLD